MKAVVLSSGGLDSTTCLAVAVDKIGKENVSTVSIFYGQRHARELSCARMVAEYYGVNHYEFDAAEIMKNSNSALLNSSGKNLEHSSYGEQVKKNSRVATYVPFRNGLMLSMAASFADSLYNGAEVEIYIGVHQDDSAVNAYPDCSAEFIKAIGDAVEIGTYGKIKIVAPFLGKTKADVVRIGTSLAVPYEITWSCYERGDKPCGHCATCIDRAKAFAENGIVDPALKSFGS
ncbi:MAG: 7-cyano-7-deazaguanine synthase QueC [Selenomonadaceae bacterium]|nr:7-cyano-7-deazaguanine synthase QueC [Selenomonadaceae bacterium]